MTNHSNLLIFSSYFYFSYNLPIVFIIINNGGIYSGVDTDSFKEMASKDAALKYILLFN